MINTISTWISPRRPRFHLWNHCISQLHEVVTGIRTFGETFELLEKFAMHPIKKTQIIETENLLFLLLFLSYP